MGLPFSSSDNGVDDGATGRVEDLVFALGKEASVASLLDDHHRHERLVLGRDEIERLVDLRDLVLLDERELTVTHTVSVDDQLGRIRAVYLVVVLK